MTGMRGKKRNRVQRASHRQKIAELRLTGHTVHQIVRMSKLSKSTVQREFRALAADWLEAAAIATDEHRAVELARLEQIEREAFAEWERSKLDYAKEFTESVKGMCEQAGFETKPKVVKRETGGRIGDARFLQIILNAQERRAKLLGLDAPTKVAPTDPTGEQPYDRMSDAEIDARIAELAAKEAAAAAPEAE